MVRKYSNVQGYKFSHVENLDDNASSVLEVSMCSMV